MPNLFDRLCNVRVIGEHSWLHVDEFCGCGYGSLSRSEL